MKASLQVVMYHYIRDLPNTSFPRIKGMLTRDFREQLATLQSRYEMGTLESALDFMRGSYRPSRDLCLLTFDDGLKEHYAEITPILIDQWGSRCLFRNHLLPRRNLCRTGSPKPLSYGCYGL